MASPRKKWLPWISKISGTITAMEGCGKFPPMVVFFFGKIGIKKDRQFLRDRLSFLLSLNLRISVAVHHCVNLDLIFAQRAFMIRIGMVILQIRRVKNGIDL